MCCVQRSISCIQKSISCLLESMNWIESSPWEIPTRLQVMVRSTLLLQIVVSTSDPRYLVQLCFLLFDNISRHAKDLIIKLLKVNPVERMLADDILKNTLDCRILLWLWELKPWWLHSWEAKRGWWRKRRLITTRRRANFVICSPP